jgi:hypothetical protein
MNRNQPPDVLKHCPFCGGPQDNAGQYPFPSSRDRDSSWIARCGNPECAAEIEQATRAKTIAAWNNRVPPNA